MDDAAPEKSAGVVRDGVAESRAYRGAQKDGRRVDDSRSDETAGDDEDGGAGEKNADDCQ
jgi:hypothetical protein